MGDLFVMKNKKDRSKGEGKNLELSVAKRSQKAPDGNKRSPQTEVEIHHSQVNVADPEEQGTDAARESRLTSESTPVEQGHVFAESFGTIDEKRCRNCPISHLKDLRFKFHRRTSPC